MLKYFIKIWQKTNRTSISCLNLQFTNTRISTMKQRCCSLELDTGPKKLKWKNIGMEESKQYNTIIISISDSHLCLTWSGRTLLRTRMAKPLSISAAVKSCPVGYSARRPRLQGDNLIVCLERIECSSLVTPRSD